MPRDWWGLIYGPAAIREQFPSRKALMDERPWCAADMARQKKYYAENRLSMAGLLFTREDRERADIEDADRFIAAAEERKRVKFLAHIKQRREAA